LHRRGLCYCSGSSRTLFGESGICCLRILMAGQAVLLVLFSVV
jgi:hypothetical protein